jgi:hypothetical protein
MRFCALSVLTVLAVPAATDLPRQPAAAAVERGVRFLLQTQGRDGGWGQDGGETSVIRVTERLETQGNDVANTAVATLALVRAGHLRSPAVQRSVDFILREIEASPEEGLAVTRVTGSQIQRKLGPYIDTFLSSMLLSDLDGRMPDTRANARVRAALDKCVRKIQRHQQSDGSWNTSGGWAPILGTSLASRSLDTARRKGVKVDPVVLARVDDYTKKAANEPAASGVVGGAAAGVALYAGAQQLEQMTRSEADRARNEKEIRSVTAQLSQPRFVRGFGSMGGEEFFSYLNISDSLRRAGGPEWTRWNGQIQTTLVELQNQDGSWAGHHCITGRVAVTSAALLTLMAEK